MKEVTPNLPYGFSVRLQQSETPQPRYYELRKVQVNTSTTTATDSKLKDEASSGAETGSTKPSSKTSGRKALQFAKDKTSDSGAGRGRTRGWPLGRDKEFPVEDQEETSEIEINRRPELPREKLYFAKDRGHHRGWSR